MSHLPYEVKTATGEKIAFDFPLHAETQSAMRVSQLLDAVSVTLDRELRVLGNTANGDVMQALAMMLAVRAAMLHAPFEVGQQLAVDLAATALAAAGQARPLLPSRPEWDEKLTIRPPPISIMSCAAACEQRKVPTTLTSSI